MVHTRLLPLFEALGVLRDPWQRLSVASDLPCFYSTHAWLQAWHEAFAGTAKVEVAAIYRAGQLIGLMPLMSARALRGPALSLRFDYCPADERFLLERSRYRFVPVGQLTPVVNLESGNLRGDLLSAPADRNVCLHALLEALRARRGWDVGIFPCAEGDVADWLAAARSAGLPAYAREGGRAFFGVRQVTPWDDYLHTRSRKFRAGVRQADNRAARFKGGLACATSLGAERASQALEMLLEVAKRSWKVTGRERLDFAPTLTCRSIDFFRRLCRQKSIELTPYVQLQHAGGKPYAGIFGLLCNRVLHTIATYYDPEATAPSLGTLVFRDVHVWSADNGVRSIDFNGSSEFVQRFSDYRLPYHQVVLFPRTLYSRTLFSVSGVLNQQRRFAGARAS